MISLGDHRVIWAQFYDHEGHEEHEGENFLLKIKETPANTNSLSYIKL
jgi:hypothetical protein